MIEPQKTLLVAHVKVNLMKITYPHVASNFIHTNMFFVLENLAFMSSF